MQKIDLLNTKFIIRKNRIVSGMVLIQMQITIEGQRVFLSNSQKIELELWDLKSCRAIGKSTKSTVLDDLLDRMKVNATKVYNEMKSVNDDVTVDELRKRLSGTDKDRKKKLLEVCVIFNSNAQKLIDIEISKITWGRYQTYKSRLAKFIRTRFNSDDLYFVNLKYSFIMESHLSKIK